MNERAGMADLAPDKVMTVMADRPRKERREPAWLTGSLSEEYEVQINGCAE